MASLTSGGAAAQTWRLHTAIEGERPFLCKDADSIGMVVDIAARAQEARAQRDTDKAERLLDLAGRLQGEICRRPAADDVIILRCRVQSRTIAGVAISTVKVSALLRAEPSQGEQAFFAWKAGAIEDAPPGEATTKADTRWCQTADQPVEATPDLVLRLQHRFYDFGMHMPQVNGVLTPETVQAITSFQKWAGLPATGQLTRRTLARIDETPTPSPWAAIAFDGFGKYGAVTGATRRGAESDAIARLRQRSRADFKVSSVASPRCLAIATVSYRERTGRRVTTFTQAFTRGGDSREDAAGKVLQYCEGEKGGGRCQVRESLCTVVAQAPPRPDGAGDAAPRFDRDTPPVNAPPPRFDRGAPPVNAQPFRRFDGDAPPVNAQPPRR